MLHQSKFGEDWKRNITFGPFTVSPNTKNASIFVSQWLWLTVWKQSVSSNTLSHYLKVRQKNNNHETSASIVSDKIWFTDGATDENLALV